MLVVELYLDCIAERANLKRSGCIALNETHEMNRETFRHLTSILVVDALLRNMAITIARTPPCQASYMVIRYWGHETTLNSSHRRAVIKMFGGQILGVIMAFPSWRASHPSWALTWDFFSLPMRLERTKALFAAQILRPVEDYSCCNSLNKMRKRWTRADA